MALPVPGTLRQRAPAAGVKKLTRLPSGSRKRSERLPQGIVVGSLTTVGEDRTFRLDRIADVRALPGSFEPPAGLDPAERVLSGLAAAPYRHEVTLRVRRRH